jgi:membrane-bound ClpP family serine protease
VILAATKTVKKDSKAAAAKSTLKLMVKAKGRALESLRRKGRVKVKGKFTFTPSGGEPASKSKSVRLIRKQNVGAGSGTKH